MVIFMRKLAPALAIVLLLTACGASSQESASGPNPATEYCASKSGTIEVAKEETGDVAYCVLADGTREDAWDYFYNSTPIPGWTQTSFFTPAESDKKAKENFTGRISFATTKMELDVNPADKFVQNPWAWWGLFDFLSATDPTGASPVMELDAQLFPGLDIDFFTSPDGDLVPVQRDIIRRPIAERTDSFWEIIANPGRVWAANASDGKYASWDKAAFPFSLVQSQEGEAWIGLATFYYKDGKISDTKIQLTSDTAGGFIFWDPDFDVNAWGQIPTTFTADTVTDESALQDAFTAEKASKLPTKPLADLGAEVVAAAAAFDPKPTLSVGVVHDGVLYIDPVKTPFGDYPYPTDMRVGVWSATKSLVPGMAALRLAEKFGTDFLDTKIVDYFEAGKEFDYVDAASEARWKEVTIKNALQMETGMGQTGYDTNWAGDNINTYKWGYSYELAEMIRYYFNVTPNPDVTGPGQKFTYIDQDMWIAALAMERFLQKQEGPEASLIKMLRNEVYAPIGASHFALGTNYTPTGELGNTYGGWGALPTLDILAKAGMLISNGGATTDGKQILSSELLGTFTKSADYQLAFWKTTSSLNGSDVYIPTMSGAGGNKVLSLPNKTSIVVLGRDDYNASIPEDKLGALVTAVLKLGS
jgi:putative hemolysin